jgi:ubiquinone/menaquinone biosynthesis C-methylase UbiE
MSRYDAFAGWYADRAAAGTWVDATILANIEPLLGPVDDLDLLDLCCGEGSFARRLAALGGRVTGADLSPRLLEIARERASDGSPEFILDDAQSLASLDDDRFDGATCLMALMDIPDLAATYAAVRRVVRPGGWFVAVITHPCFESPHAGWTGAGARLTERYLTEGEWRSRYAAGVRGKVGAWHRTLSSYVNEALGAGWILDRLLEPPNVEPDNPNPDIPRIMFLRFR